MRFTSTATAGVQKAALGNGVFLTGDDLPQLLSFAKIRREALVDDGLLFVRRKYEDGHVYFVSNSGNEKINGWVPLSVNSVGVAQFDPMSERSGVATSRKSANGVAEVFIQLGPGESCVLQTSAAAIKGKAFPYFSATGTSEILAGEWEIKFTDGGPKLPATVRTTQLGSWTALPGDEVKSFSGTAQFNIALKKPGYSPEAWLLDLGSVGESAEVVWNGNKLGTLIGPAYHLVFSHALLKADNLLQINVTNGMANRIADLDRRGVDWKKFYNTNFPSRLAENRNAYGLFDASKWKPKASGLIGPVTMTPVKFN